VSLTHPRFDVTRSNGRSNAQVVIDLVKDGEPGVLYSYAQIAQALEQLADRTFDVPHVRAAVIGACPRLLKEYQRALHNVRLVGYRLAFASEHSRLALFRRRRADVQLRYGLRLLQHVRWEEMDENTRRAHQGHLMVTQAIVANQHALERRMNAVEQAIDTLRK
jgi:hypothetical protein